MYTNPAFSQRVFDISKDCTDLPSRAPTVSCCDGLFSQTHILSTLPTTVLSALTSRLGRLNAVNGAAVLLRFCVRLGSNYFNYTAAAFRRMFGSCYVCWIKSNAVCPNQQIKSSKAQFVNLRVTLKWVKLTVDHFWDAVCWGSSGTVQIVLFLRNASS